MVLKPQTREELSRMLAESTHLNQPIKAVDLHEINRLIEHKPEDMTATVEAGMTVARLQEEVGRAGQWLPIDLFGAQAVTVGDLLAANRSGPRRFGYGTVRDYLIGISVVLASGVTIKAGGRVVKNVAGYDLCKLFIGARHSLGIIVEGTFKLRPLPETEVILESSFETMAALNSTVGKLRAAPIDPVIFDAHRMAGRLTLVIAFAGAREDVAYQVELAQRITGWDRSSTAYDAKLRNTFSVLPNSMADALAPIERGRFIARLGNGVIYHDGEPLMKRMIPNAALAARLKTAYDPHGILPDYLL